MNGSKDRGGKKRETIYSLPMNGSKDREGKKGKVSIRWREMGEVIHISHFLPFFQHFAVATRVILSPSLYNVRDRVWIPLPPL